MTDFNKDIFKIKHNNIAPTKGRILISEPFSSDLFFKRSVVLLTEHTEQGSVGFILNKPVEFPIHEVLKDFPEFDANISIGGPVKTDTVHYIHTHGKQIPDSVHVMNNLYWGGDFGILKKNIIEGNIMPNEVRFFVGYSGWSPNQLNTEIDKDYWLVTELEVKDIMERVENVWKQSLKRLGEKYQLWTNFPENPAMN